VLLIDTPGFDDSTRTDSEILTEIARILSAQYALGVELKGIVYIHRITDVRYNRAAIKTFEIFKKVCGEEPLSNVLLVTSRWDGVDLSVGAGRERQLKTKFWAYMIGHGSNMSRFYGDRPSAIGLVSQLLCRDKVVLKLQKELVDEGKSLDSTAAGAYVSDNLEIGLGARISATEIGPERAGQSSASYWYRSPSGDQREEIRTFEGGALHPIHTQRITSFRWAATGCLRYFHGLVR
jgi:hypothetical protein